MPVPVEQNLALAGWTARPEGDCPHIPAVPIRATVPGCIHTDLMDAGLIRDPRVGDAEEEVQWVSWVDWRYEVEFEAQEGLFAHDEIDLVFEQLDTIAVVEVNGIEVGRAESEFLPWRFSVKDALRRGRNTLAVTFTSPLRYVEQEAARLGARPVNGAYPAYNMIRKCASNFEWDWGPRVATCGVTGGVGLEGWSGARLGDVGIVTRRSEGDDWTVEVAAELMWGRTRRDDLRLRVEIAHDSGLFVTRTLGLCGSESRARLTVGVASPGVWLARSRGTNRAPYRSLVRLEEPIEHNGEPTTTTLSSYSTPIAFRTVGLETETGERFALAVNGAPVYCRGVNWIPEGLFPRDRTKARVRERLEQVVAANMNMIRVWGGGRYEPDWFYDLCDELGIMVWQDFMFSCACYPEEEPIRSLVEREARHQVARLSRHPCVVLWCGGNECEWAHESWGFKEMLAPGRTWGRWYYRELLPRVCAEVSPGTPYIPNSPFSPDAGVHPNDASQGDAHVWEVWGEGYRGVVPRFCSEFGQQGPSCVETLVEAGVVKLDGEASLAHARGSDELTRRQRGPGGNKRWYEEPMAAWFREPRDFGEWHYLAQLLQARSLSIGIEWQRANMGKCMGSLIWQMNDAWPGMSWALVDSAGRKKMAYDAAKASFADRMLTIQPVDGRVVVFGINDTDAVWSGSLVVSRFGLDGLRLKESTRREFKVRPFAAASIADVVALVGEPTDPRREFVIATSLEMRVAWFALPDRELYWPSAGFRVETRAGAGRLLVRVTAQTPLRDVVVVAPGAEVTPAVVGLMMPGEVREFEVCGEVRRGVASLVVRCANQFGLP